MTDQADIPDPLPWDQRSKGVRPMPGGYPGYIHALRQICEYVVNEEPSQTDLVGWIQGHFSLSAGSATWREGFLHTTSVVESSANQIKLSEHASRWYVAADDGILIGLLHSRLQYFGEMLSELRAGPRSLEELRQAAGKYNLNWDSDTQVQSRRGWLESANLVEPDGKGHLAITDAGRDLLSKLDVHSPDSMPEHTHAGSRPEPTPDRIPTSKPEAMPPSSAIESEDSSAERGPSPVEALAREIQDASTDSKNPDRLEAAVREAFHFLGFEAEKLGGRGQTDVLVNAPLGKNDSYTVTIDAKTVGATKTVGAGSLEDRQVNWHSLEDHRKQHNADYSMLVGPNPSGKKLMDHAIDSSVAVLSTDQLAELCLQHSDAPLGLQDYRALFESGGAVDTVSIGKAAQDLTRLRDLAGEICGKLAEQIKAFGPIGAIELRHLLDQPTDTDVIQQVLDTLASPLVGAIQGTANEGYVVATAPWVIQQRLHQLGNHLATLESSQDQ